MTVLQVTTKYRVDTENEAISLIQNIKDNAKTEGYEVKKSSYSAKNKKSKGQIIDEWFVVEVCVKYNEEYIQDGE